MVHLQSAVAVFEDADGEVVRNASKVLGGLSDLERCADLEALSADVDPPPPVERVAVETARRHLAAAEARRRAGRFQASREAVLEAERALHGVTYTPILGALASARAYNLDDLGRFDEAIQGWREALRLAVLNNDRHSVSHSASGLMFVQGFRSRDVEQALALRPVLEGAATGNPRDEVHARNVVALLLAARGELEDAEAELRLALAVARATPDNDGLLIRTLGNLGFTLTRMERANEAEPYLRQGLALEEELLGPDHPDVGMTHVLLGMALSAEKRWPDAEAEFRAAQAIYERAVGPEHPVLAEILHGLGAVLVATDRIDEAETAFLRSLRIGETTGRDEAELVEVRQALDAIRESAAQ